MNAITAITTLPSFPVGDSTGWIIDGDNLARGVTSGTDVKSLIGKPCGVCEGEGMTAITADHTDAPLTPWSGWLIRAGRGFGKSSFSGGVVTCPVCGGSGLLDGAAGLAVIELTMPCDDCKSGDPMHPLPTCLTGFVTVRVIPEHVVSIVDETDILNGATVPAWHIIVRTHTGEAWLAGPPEQRIRRINADLSEHVGRFVVIGKEVET